ncbi:Sjogren's syndrome/scleroderma autoantigen 1 family protein [Halopiger djelfimassiliensis]|uniref:Sjogren's syndrome/scleroderma autoantigen 1 family protein n=1 Tax=Halopiger djelfimassiliensis TaxID=1293047 RepID=UPI00067773C3|nr:Sjogren's syndrome/scleroderma autoantigen 1 family protein [Halopiger djelfimassiliensis]
MSDFDKEAEREKLREKYERDKAEREATQRMSDLLLKGATMTNTHCGTCGDPLFKQNGTTFCPSCHGNPDAVEGTDLEAQPAEDEADGADTETETGAAEPGTDSTPAAGTDATTDGDAAIDPSGRERQERGGADATPTDRESAPETAARSQPVRTPPSQSASTDRSAGDERRSVGRRGQRSGTSTPVDGDLEAARESLVRALEKFAGEAAATDDPRHATACLEAAREASETLNTLR